MLSDPIRVKKFVICPGWVESADGDRHWIDGQQLMKLYSVNPAECIVLKDANVNPKGFNTKYLHTLVWLTPRQDGDYDTE